MKIANGANANSPQPGRSCTAKVDVGAGAPLKPRNHARQARPARACTHTHTHFASSVPPPLVSACHDKLAMCYDPIIRKTPHRAWIYTLLTAAQKSGCLRACADANRTTPRTAQLHTRHAPVHRADFRCAISVASCFLLACDVGQHLQEQRVRRAAPGLRARTWLACGAGLVRTCVADALRLRRSPPEVQELLPPLLAAPLHRVHRGGAPAQR